MTPRLPRGARAALLGWYRRNRRALPWRESRDPYAIWVSEVMLQQTRVAAVVPYYRRFLDRFPDVATLAAADEEQVLAAWSGLGYYRRARALREAARLVVREHGGLVPSDPERLRALPGIGRYTAGAIASLAFGRPEPVLDGNVRRVLSRLVAHDDERMLWRLAGELVRGSRPGDLNQALMELGATVCTPTRPRCAGCPLARGCRARRAGDPTRHPAASARPATSAVRVAVAVVERAGRVLLERRTEASPLRGTWDLPAREVVPGADPAARLAAALGAERGLAIEIGAPLGRVDHGIMSRRLRLEVFACVLVGRAPRFARDLGWRRLDEIDEVAVSGATRKVLRLRASRP